MQAFCLTPEPRPQNFYAMSQSPLKVSANKAILTQDKFSSKALELRNYFETQFANPQSLDTKRFVWDYWNVRDQYRLLRTPAYHYFPDKLYLAFHKELVMWGRRNLGCWDISPPWLSCYIDNCYQDLHSDVPHGPWAFVYSLSPERPLFRGGETLVLKDAALNFWSESPGSRDRELDSFIERVKPSFNRLVVFDPRRPHGVRRVEGVDDPMDGRLVIHGWFSQPKTYIEGPLPPARVERLLNQALDRVLNTLDVPEDLWGTLAVGLSVAKNGRVVKAVYRTQTVKDRWGQVPTALLKKILAVYARIEFPIARDATEITLPLIFEP
jgi:hypothetical protein